MQRESVRGGWASDGTGSSDTVATRGNEMAEGRLGFTGVTRVCFTDGFPSNHRNLPFSPMGNLKKKRRLQMNKHKRRKRLKSNRHKKRTWQK